MQERKRDVQADSEIQDFTLKTIRLHFYFVNHKVTQWVMSKTFNNTSIYSEWEHG